jgi:shikimate 5-dehydrogenase
MTTTKTKTTTSEMINEMKEVKYILDLVNTYGSCTLNRLVRLCGKRFARTVSGYEMTKEQAIKQITLLVECEMLVWIKEQGGDGWNTSYKYDALALQPIRMA